MADFKETLEVTKNSTCFLSYTYVWHQEDLADGTTKDCDWVDDATLGEVADLIESFCDTEDKTALALQYLMNTGMIKLTEEY